MKQLEYLHMHSGNVQEVQVLLHVLCKSCTQEVVISSVMSSLLPPCCGGCGCGTVLGGWGGGLLNLGCAPRSSLL